MVTGLITAQLSLLLFIFISSMVYVVSPIQNYERKTDEFIQDYINRRRRKRSSGSSYHRGAVVVKF